MVTTIEIDREFKGKFGSIWAKAEVEVVAKRDKHGDSNVVGGTEEFWNVGEAEILSLELFVADENGDFEKPMLATTCPKELADMIRDTAIDRAVDQPITEWN